MSFSDNATFLVVSWMDMLLTNTKYFISISDAFYFVFRCFDTFYWLSISTVETSLILIWCNNVCSPNHRTKKQIYVFNGRSTHLCISEIYDLALCLLFLCWIWLYLDSDEVNKFISACVTSLWEVCLSLNDIFITTLFWREL